MRPSSCSSEFSPRSMKMPIRDLEDFTIEFHENRGDYEWWVADERLDEDELTEDEREKIDIYIAQLIYDWNRE